MQLLRRTQQDIEEKAAAAGFQLTASRAGKVETKKRSRPEARRVERALFPGRKKSRPAASIAAASQPDALHEFKALPKKGRKPTKVSCCLLVGA